MSNEFIKVPRLQDKAIIQCFSDLSTEHGIANVSINVTGNIPLGQVNLSSSENEALIALLEFDAALIETLSVNINGFSVVFYRGGHPNNGPSSPIYDEILFRSSQCTISEIDRMKIVAFVMERLRSFVPSRTTNDASEENSQLAAIHENTLERLERLNEDLVRESLDFRQQLEERFNDKQEQADENTNKLKRELLDEHNERTHDLQQREKELNEKLEEIDNRNNTHARRAIRDKMLEDVKHRIDNFGVSKSTERKRRPVQFGIFTLVLVLALLLLQTAVELKNNPANTYTWDSIHSALNLNLEATKDKERFDSFIKQLESTDAQNQRNTYWLWLRLTLLSFGLVGTILYYIKWENKWAESHSNSEFQLQQFHLDINRANWAIESCLEWHKETGADIPAELLDSITRNLFTSEQAQLDTVLHPADELASALIGSASQLKLNVGGNEILYDKPGKIPKTTS